MLHERDEGEEMGWCGVALAMPAEGHRDDDHVRLYPMRSYGHYGDSHNLVRDIKPIMEKYGAQLYLCGHDHDIQWIKNPSDTFTCLVSGAGGGARDTAYGDHTVFAATNGGFISMDIENMTAFISCIDARGEVVFYQKITA